MRDCRGNDINRHLKNYKRDNNQNVKQMKLTHYIYISTALAMLTACGDDIDPVYTVGEADNAIVLRAGVGEGASALTRADGDTPNDHVPFANTTQLRLYVEGTWTGKSPSTTITQYTNCTTSDANDRLDGASTDVNDIHPLASFTPQLYWDDYGTADPGNKTNRANGLAVYGVGVDGLATLPDDLKAIEKGESPAPDSWTSLGWSIKTDGEDVLSKDIIVSNNHGNNSTSTGTGIKFDQRNSISKTENLLIFEHMMSKITFILTAGDGFDNGFFSQAPEVVLTRNKHGKTTKTEYCYTEGTVNIKAASATGSNLGTVKLQVKDDSSLGIVTEHAIVFPGSDFGAEDADVIARINADGNIYYVTAAKIRAAITGDDKTTKKGTNYIIKVKVNKTDIKVSATVKKWIDIEAEEEKPVIDVNTLLGGDGDAATEAFSFYRSTSLNNGYSTTSPSLLVDRYYAEEAVVSKSGSTWTMSSQLFWPNHDTHFQFRGVYPRTETSASASAPLVYKNADNYQVIDINNAAYSSTTFPSNLMIARPDVAEDAECDNQEPDHTKTNLYSGGICANEGTINMQFHYIMSQVEVRLKTSDEDKDDHVNLTGAKVEIVGGYTAGNVKLGDLTVAPTTTGSYTLDALPGDASARDGIEAANIRHSSIVPQTLTYDENKPLDETNLRFKITIQSSDPEGTPDIYYADIQPIKVKVKGSTDAAAPVSAWESGKHYIYTLNILKTKISIKATIADWITLEGSEDVWL